MTLNVAIRRAQIQDLAVNVDKLANDAVETAKIKDKNVTLVKLEDGAEAQIIVVNAAGVPEYKAVSGDITITAAGVASIGATKVIDSMINDDVATGLAGTGLTATNGVLAVDAITDNVTESDFKQENFSGDCNDVKTDFVLAFTPIVASLRVALRGSEQEEGSGNSFTISGNTVSFSVAPLTGDVLVISYVVNN